MISLPNFIYQIIVITLLRQRQDYHMLIKKDGNFYVEDCLEIPQARGQGNTKAEAIQDTTQAINLYKSYFASKKKSTSKLVTVSV